MLNKIKIILAVSISITLLTGCGKEISVYSENYQDIMPDIVRIGGSSIIGYHYLVDKHTGVVYLEYDSGRTHSTTAMLNADGSPVTAGQLGIEY